MHVLEKRKQSFKVSTIQYTLGQIFFFFFLDTGFSNDKKFSLPFLYNYMIHELGLFLNNRVITKPCMSLLKDKQFKYSRIILGPGSPSWIVSIERSSVILKM